MSKSFKNNYLEFTKVLGGPYSLMSRGIKRGVITGIMRGSMPSIDNAYKIAQVLGVSLEHLLTGQAPDKISMIAESPSMYYTDQEKEYTDKLLTIFRAKNDDTIAAITQNIDQFLKVPDKVPLKDKKAG